VATIKVNLDAETTNLVAQLLTKHFWEQGWKKEANAVYRVLRAGSMLSINTEELFYQSADPESEDFDPENPTTLKGDIAILEASGLAWGPSK